MSEGGSPHWSKDFVEHLRTVHFTLITVCAGIFILAGSFRSYRPSHALAQLETIMDARENWNFEKIVTGAERASTSSQSIRGINLRPGLRINIVEQVPSYLPKQYDSRAAYESKPPDKLGAFKIWWQLHQKQRTYFFLNGIRFAGLATVDDSDEHLLGKFKIGDEPYPNPTGVVQLSPIGVNATIVQDKFDQDELDRVDWVGRWEKYRFRVQASVVRRELTEKNFIGELPASCSSDANDYPTCFPDLADASVDLENVWLDDMKAHLIEQLEKGDTVFEAFGLKVPLSQLTFWGIIIIASIQFYLYLHLMELHSKVKPDDSGWDIAWVGVYESIQSKMLFFISICILPFCAVFLLVCEAWSPTIHLKSVALRITAAAALLLSLPMTMCLSWICWKYRPLAAKVMAEAKVPSQEKSSTDDKALVAEAPE